MHFQGGRKQKCTQPRNLLHLAEVSAVCLRSRALGLSHPEVAPQARLTPLHSLAVNLQEVATRPSCAGSASRTCCTGGGIQVHIVPAGPVSSSHQRQGSGEGGAEARACLGERTHSRTQCYIKKESNKTPTTMTEYAGTVCSVTFFDNNISLSYCPCNNYALEVRKKKKKKTNTAEPLTRRGQFRIVFFFGGGAHL